MAPPMISASLNKEALVSSMGVSCAMRGAAKRATKKTAKIRGLRFLFILPPLKLVFFLMGDGSRNVDTGQENEDESLDDRGKDGHSHEREGEKEGDDGGHSEDEHLFSKDVSEESDREGDRTGEMTDDFDRDHKRSQERNGPCEMF